ncbi:hypothetical protein LCGC14_2086300, partial [marine sediment metagenome]
YGVDDSAFPNPLQLKVFVFNTNLFFIKG